MKKKIEFTESSGNVFADVGLPNPEEWLAKANLAIQINDLIKEKKLNQTKAAQLLGIDQPKISDLNTGKLAGFSLERLFRFLNILGQDITINVTPKKRTKKEANISVAFAKITTKRTVIQPRQTTFKNAPVQARKKNK